MSPNPTAGGCPALPTQAGFWQNQQQTPRQPGLTLSPPCSPPGAGFHLISEHLSSPPSKCLVVSLGKGVKEQLCQPSLPAFAAGALRGNLGVGPAVPASRWLHSRGRSRMMDTEGELPGAGRDVWSQGAGSCLYPSRQAGSLWRGFSLLCSRGGASRGESCATLPAGPLDSKWGEPPCPASPPGQLSRLHMSQGWKDPMVHRSAPSRFIAAGRGFPIPAATSPELGR